MILAGDVGGTKVHLALYNFTEGRLEPVRDQKFPAHEFASLDEVQEAALEPGGILAFSGKKPDPDELRHHELLERIEQLSREMAAWRSAPTPPPA